MARFTPVQMIPCRFYMDYRISYQESGFTSTTSSVFSTENTKGYRYAFNGKEQDPEWNGVGNMYDYGFRIYDPRIAKFLSTDPLTSSFSYLTPYQYASNAPVACIDIDGLEAVITVHSAWYGEKLTLEFANAKETGDFTEFRRLAHRAAEDFSKDKWQNNEFVKNGNEMGLPTSFDFNRDENPPGLTVIVNGQQLYDPMNDFTSEEEELEDESVFSKIGRLLIEC